MRWPFLVLGAYLLGSISFSYLIVRRLTGRDVRSVGSGNPGATNVLRASGRRPALAVLLLDIAKGLGPVLAARALAAPTEVIGAVAVATVLGHVFPVFLRFRGGKGVATASGALGGLAPVPLALAIVLFVAVIAGTRYVSLGSIVAAISFPFWWLLASRLGLAADEPRLIAAAAAIALLVVFRHRANLERLMQGTERRLGEREAAR